MTKHEYLAQLEAALTALPLDERNEALRYYGDYFDESGMAESEVIARLGTPREVADTILRDFYTGSEKSWNTAIPYANSDSSRKDRSFQSTFHRIKNSFPTWVWVIVGFLTLPIWGTMLLSAVGIVFGSLCALFGILLSLCFVVVALVGSGVALLTSGLIALFTTPAMAFIAIGSGLLVLAVGLATTIPTVWIFGLIPKAFRWISRALRSAFSGNREGIA